MSTAGMKRDVQMTACTQSIELELRQTRLMQNPAVIKAEFGLLDDERKLDWIPVSVSVDFVRCVLLY
jgi:hypothetical protein